MVDKESSDDLAEKLKKIRQDYINSGGRLYSSDEISLMRYEWICPNCGTVNGPHQACCAHCTPPPKVTC